MKITIITPYWLGTKGGITTVVHHLSNELKRNKHLVQVLTPDGGQGTVKLPKKQLALTWRTIQILRNIKPDVIHIHGHGSLLLAPVIYKILHDKCVRIIFTFHTQPHTVSYLTGKLSKERGIIRQAIFNYLLKQCDSTTYVSQSLMDSLRKTGIKTINPVVISNGVMAKTVKPDDVVNLKQEYNLINKYPILCMIATLAWDWKVKGIEILIQAFKKMLVSQPKARLVMVGDGRYRKFLENCTKKEGLNEKVIFTGNMDNPFIALSVCDIYCHISLNEACPIAPLEAMIAGKPIVASRDGGLPEIITNGFNGILVSSNPDSVAKAILALVKKPDFMQDLSGNAIVTTKTKFSWERITKEYIKLYKNGL